MERKFVMSEGEKPKLSKEELRIQKSVSNFIENTYFKSKKK